MTELDQFGEGFERARAIAAARQDSAFADMHRDGKTYVHERDARRLAGQHCRVFALMKDGKWRTLAEIAAATGDPESSVSARLRDLRKKKFGAHTVDREYVERGLFRYRLWVNRKDLFDSAPG